MVIQSNVLINLDSKSHLSDCPWYNQYTEILSVIQSVYGKWKYLQRWSSSWWRFSCDV